jgi:hypothetical protein
VNDDKQIQRRKWTYSLSQIAEAAAASVFTVRRHVKEGKLNPDSLVSVSCYIASRRLQDAMVIGKISNIPL